MIASLMRQTKSRLLSEALPAIEELRRRGYELVWAPAFRPADDRGRWQWTKQRPWEAS